MVQHYWFYSNSSDYIRENLGIGRENSLCTLTFYTALVFAKLLDYFLKCSDFLMFSMSTPLENFLVFLIKHAQTSLVLNKKPAKPGSWSVCFTSRLNPCYLLICRLYRSMGCRSGSNLSSLWGYSMKERYRLLLRGFLLTLGNYRPCRKSKKTTLCPESG